MKCTACSVIYLTLLHLLRVRSEHVWLGTMSGAVNKRAAPTARFCAMLVGRTVMKVRRYSSG